MTTGKERIEGILNKNKVEPYSWTTLIDAETRQGMSEDICNLHPFDFYRNIGCDILQLGDHGFWGTDDAVGSPARLVTPEINVKKTINSDGSEEITSESTWGQLTTVYQNGHPLKYPVGSIEELRVLKNIWSNSKYVEDTSENFESRLINIQQKIGDSGIYAHSLSPSPVQRLLEYEMGVINFNYLVADHPDEIKELLDIMHECRKQEYEILSRRTTIECIIPMENTSTAMISPEQYEKYSLPQLSDYVDIIHRYNKKAILHMCGHLNALLHIIKETGLDGVNALTPSPVGDTIIKDALDVLGEDIIILGGIFDPSVFQKEGVTPEEIWRTLDAMYTPDVINANLLLWIQADGIPTPYQNFIAVRDWFESKKENNSCLN